MRKLEPRFFNEYAAIHGRLWREDLAVESRIPFELIDRGYKGKRRFTDAEMANLCRAFGLDLETLFPLVEKKKESA